MENLRRLREVELTAAAGNSFGVPRGVVLLCRHGLAPSASGHVEICCSSQAGQLVFGCPLMQPELGAARGLMGAPRRIESMMG